MSIIKEKTKRKPIGKKKILLKFFISAMSGLIFATCAAGMFVYLEQRLSQRLEEKQGQVIVIGKEDTSSEDQEESEDSEITEADVQGWQYSLYATGMKMNSSMVTLGEKGESCGAIVALHGNQIIILAIDCKDVELTKVQFSDGTVAEGTVLGYDTILDIAMVSVKGEELTSIIKNQITVMQIGSSTEIRQGQYVIAIGKPLGEFGTISTGIIRKNNDMLMDVDRGCDLFATDIMSNEKSSGFIIEEGGALVGIITQKDIKETNVLHALGISNVVEIIDRMANKKAIPYLGIQGTTVTKEMNAQYGLPWGVYVEQVKSDSPAIRSNICAGDVIVEIDGHKITTMEDLQNALMETEVGQKLKVTLYRQVNGELSELIYFAIVGMLNMETVKR